MPFYQLDPPTPVVRTPLGQPAAPPPDSLDPDLAFWRQVGVPIWPFTGPPTTGTYPQGWLGVDNTATLWVCTTGGTPGAWAAVGGGAPTPPFASTGLWYLDPRFPVTVGGVAQWTACPWDGVHDDYPGLLGLYAFANTLSVIPQVAWPAGSFRMSNQVDVAKGGFMGMGVSEHDVQCFYDGPSNLGPFKKTNGSFGVLTGATFRPGTTPLCAQYIDFTGAASVDYGCILDGLVFSADGEQGAIIDVLLPPVAVNVCWGQRTPLRINNPVTAGVKFAPSAGTVQSNIDIRFSYGTSNHLPTGSLTGPAFWLDNSAGANLGNIRLHGPRWEQNQQTNAFKITDGNNTVTGTTMVTSQIPAFATTAGLVGLPVSFPGVYPTGTKIATIGSGFFTVTLPTGGTVTSQGSGLTGTVGVTGMVRLTNPSGRVTVSLGPIGYQPGAANSPFASLVYAEAPVTGSQNQTFRLVLDRVAMNNGQLFSVLDGDVPTMPVLPVSAYYPLAVIGSNTVAGESDAYFDTLDVLTNVVAVVLTTFTANAYTLALTDANTAQQASNGATPASITIPAAASVAFAVGTVITITQTGAGKISLTAAGGVTVTSSVAGGFVSGTTGCRADFSTIGLLKTGANTWVLSGDVA